MSQTYSSHIAYAAIGAVVTMLLLLLGTTPAHAYERNTYPTINEDEFTTPLTVQVGDALAWYVVARDVDEEKVFLEARRLPDGARFETSIIGDMNFDGVVDLLDYNSYWLHYVGTDEPIADYNNDGAVDPIDFNEFLMNVNVYAEDKLGQRSGFFTWTPTAEDAGLHTLTFEAEDASGNTASTRVTLHVRSR